MLKLANSFKSPRKWFENCMPETSNKATNLNDWWLFVLSGQGGGQDIDHF